MNVMCVSISVFWKQTPTVSTRPEIKLSWMNEHLTLWMNEHLTLYVCLILASNARLGRPLDWNGNRLSSTRLTGMGIAFFPTRPNY